MVTMPIIESDGKGKWVECSCHSCYIDETQYYCRVGGNFDEFEVEKDGEWLLASKYIATTQKEEETNENKNKSEQL